MSVPLFTPSPNTEKYFQYTNPPQLKMMSSKSPQPMFLNNLPIEVVLFVPLVVEDELLVLLWLFIYQLFFNGNILEGSAQNFPEVLHRGNVYLLVG